MTVSIKDKIADALRTEGFDFMTAYEEADRVIKEFVASGKPEATYTTKSGTNIVLARNNKPKGK